MYLLDVLESQREAVPRNDGGELDSALAFLSFARSCVLKKFAGLRELIDGATGR